MRSGTGLLLFFHADSAWDKRHRDSYVVLVDPSLPGGLRGAPDGITAQPPLAITGWREVTDYPWDESCNRLPGYSGLAHLTESFGSTTIGMAMGPDGIEYPEKEILERGIPALGHCFECDKIGGWPRWEQGDETPGDGKGLKMDYLFQIGHEGILLGDIDAGGIEWPTTGRGHVFRSRKGGYRYVWACD